MVFKSASNITVKTSEFHYVNKFAKKSNQHQQKTAGILSLALTANLVKDKRKEKTRMVTCCCCSGHPGPWAQGSLSSGGCWRVCACEFSLETALRERMTVSQPEVPPALRCGSSWPGGRWAFVTCWWKENQIRRAIVVPVAHVGGGPDSLCVFVFYRFIKKIYIYSFLCCAEAFNFN